MIKTFAIKAIGFFLKNLNSEGRLPSFTMQIQVKKMGKNCPKKPEIVLKFQKKRQKLIKKSHIKQRLPHGGEEFECLIS